MHAWNNFILNTEITIRLSCTLYIWMKTWKYVELFWYTLLAPLGQMCVESWITERALDEEFLPQLPPYCLWFVSCPGPLQTSIGARFTKRCRERFPVAYEGERVAVHRLFPGPEFLVFQKYVFPALRSNVHHRVTLGEWLLNWHLEVIAGTKIRPIKNIKSVLWFKKFKKNISFRLLYYGL